MRTITFTPHSDLKKLDAKFKAKWAKALMTSVQHKDGMANASDTAHCCLCVAAIVEGVSAEYYMGERLPSEAVHPEEFNLSKQAEHLYAARSDELIGGVRNHNFDLLNDSYLTHPQIAALLRGESVTIEVGS